MSPPITIRETRCVERGVFEVELRHNAGIFGQRVSGMNSAQYLYICRWTNDQSP
jgi:hypothetical protein